MNFSSMILTVLMIGLTFLFVGLIIQDFNMNYQEIEINDTFSGRFDNTSSIMTKTQPLEDKIRDIDKEESGWKIFGQGLVVLPLIVITFVSVVFSSMGIILSLITSFADILNLPTGVLGIVLAMATVFIIFKIVGWWQKSDT